MYCWDIWEDDVVYIHVGDDMEGADEDMRSKYEEVVWGGY